MPSSSVLVNKRPRSTQLKPSVSTSTWGPPAGVLRLYQQSPPSSGGVTAPEAAQFEARSLGVKGGQGQAAPPGPKQTGGTVTPKQQKCESATGQTASDPSSKDRGQGDGPPKSLIRIPDQNHLERGRLRAVFS